LPPPGLPADRVRLLRDAFAKTLRDPDLRAEAKKKNLGVDPMSGEDLEALAKEVLSANKELIDRMNTSLASERPWQSIEARRFCDICLNIEEAG
jgi:tripartite-type tricarboxylate transporter receptor subunit TctC